jgi:FMN phosphatase YigB (HAD superfamily)
MDVYRETWHCGGFDLPDDLLYELLDAEQACWDRAVRVDQDAIPVLTWLGANGVKRGICSNAPFPPEMMRRQLLSTGLAQQVDGAVFSSELGRRKPSRDVYMAALDAIGTTPEATLFVGDRLREDYEGPVAVGMRAVILTKTAASAVQGPATIASLAQLPALL